MARLDFATDASAEHTGGILSLLPDDPDTVAVAGGDDPENLHVTVLYIADDATGMTDDEKHAIALAIGKVAEGLGPIEATVSGAGRLGSEGATVLFLDSPEIVALHEAVLQAAQDAGITLADQWPTFIPHLTLAYESAEAFAARAAELAALQGTTILFSHLGLHLGDEAFERELGAPVSEGETDEVVGAEPEPEAAEMRVLRFGYGEADGCPTATHDIALNLENRQHAIDTAGYGPLNPAEPNDEFWQEKADRWEVGIEEAQQQLCGNCAAFIRTDSMLACIESGLAAGDPDPSDADAVIDAATLGYCEAFDFKCAAARTCDAWIVGGPVTDEVAPAEMAVQFRWKGNNNRWKNHQKGAGTGDKTGGIGGDSGGGSGAGRGRAGRVPAGGARPDREVLQNPKPRGPRPPVGDEGVVPRVDRPGSTVPHSQAYEHNKAVEARLAEATKGLENKPRKYDKAAAEFFSDPENQKIQLASAESDGKVTDVSVAKWGTNEGKEIRYLVHKEQYPGMQGSGSKAHQISADKQILPDQKYLGDGQYEEVPELRFVVSEPHQGGQIAAVLNREGIRPNPDVPVTIGSGPGSFDVSVPPIGSLEHDGNEWYFVPAGEFSGRRAEFRWKGNNNRWKNHQKGAGAGKGADGLPAGGGSGKSASKGSGGSISYDDPKFESGADGTVSTRVGGGRVQSVKSSDGYYVRSDFMDPDGPYPDAPSANAAATKHARTIAAEVSAPTRKPFAPGEDGVAVIDIDNGEFREVPVKGVALTELKKGDKVVVNNDGRVTIGTVGGTKRAADGVVSVSSRAAVGSVVADDIIGRVTGPSGEPKHIKIGDDGTAALVAAAGMLLFGRTSTQFMNEGVLMDQTVCPECGAGIVDGACVECGWAAPEGMELEGMEPESEAMESEAMESEMEPEAAPMPVDGTTHVIVPTVGDASADWLLIHGEGDMPIEEVVAMLPPVEVTGGQVTQEALDAVAAVFHEYGYEVMHGDQPLQLPGVPDGTATIKVRTESAKTVAAMRRIGVGGFGFAPMAMRDGKGRRREAAASGDVAMFRWKGNKSPGFRDKLAERLVDDVEAMYGDDSDFTALVADGAADTQPWEGILVIEGIPSGDGRTIASDGLSWRDLPLPLMCMLKNPDGGSGHDGAHLAGRIDWIERRDNNEVWGGGVLDLGSEFGREAARLMANGFLRGVSVDLDEVEMTMEGDDTDPLAGLLSGGSMTIGKGRVMGATITPFPAFQEAQLVLTDRALAATGGSHCDCERQSALVAAAGKSRCHVEVRVFTPLPIRQEALVASSGAPVNPPIAWFADPKLDGPTPLRVTAEGRVFGHVATWGSCHIGFGDRCVGVPRTNSGYRYVCNKQTLTAEGTLVATAPIVMDTVHPNLQLRASDAQAFYADTGCAVADVAVFEDRHGIVVAGAMRPTARPEQVRAFRGSDVSPDWRTINGRLEMVGLLAVNTSGFVTPALAASAGSGDRVLLPGRVAASVKSNEVAALVAAGMMSRDEHTSSRAVAELAAEVAELKRLVAPMRAERAMARLKKKRKG